MFLAEKTVLEILLNPGLTNTAEKRTAHELKI